MHSSSPFARPLLSVTDLGLGRLRLFLVAALCSTSFHPMHCSIGISLDDCHYRGPPANSILADLHGNRRVRAPGYEFGGREFESLRARHLERRLGPFQARKDRASHHTVLVALRQEAQLFGEMGDALAVVCVGE